MATALDPALNPDVFGMQPRLPTAAPKPATPMAAAEERLAGTEEKLGTALKQQAEFAGAQAEQERKQIAAKAKGEAEILGKQAEELRAAEEPIRVAEEEKMKARFSPTRETAMEMAGLYSLIGVLGFAIGRGGKQSSLQAMSAMNGMMEGYRQGSTDRFNQEKKLFDSHLKSLTDNISTLTSRLQRVVQLSTVDKLKAEQELTVALAESGADFVKQNINKFGLPATIQYLKQVQSAAQRAVDKEREFERKAEQKVAEQQKAFEQKKELAQLAASLKGTGRTATQQLFMAQRAVNALGGVASATEGLMALPAGTTMQILPNLTTKDGMINFMRNAAARTMTASEAKAMETLFTGVTRNLAAIEASGAATGLVGLSGQLEKLRPVAGDKAVDVALKMADIRRIAAENIEPLIQSGLMPPQQAGVAENLVKRIEKAIPFTTTEVIDAAYGGKGKKTIGEASKEIVAPKTAPATGWSAQDEQRLRQLEEKARGTKSE